MTCLAQNTNPQLFQTWYLNFVQTSDLDTPFNVFEIEPQISPTLTISNELNYNGEGACNAFEGVFVNIFSDYIESSIFSPTTNDCNFELHNSFESSYFYFLQYGGTYQIIPQVNGLILIISNPIFGSAVFTNFKLNMNDFDFSQITIYPNPIESNFTLKSDKLNISRIQIINSLGQNVKTIQNEFGNIDVSNLNSGVYILKIDTEFGILQRKIIKRN
jgi:hypothetical protein